MAGRGLRIFGLWEPSRKKRAYWLIRLELLLLLVASPLLWFPSLRPGWTAVALGSLVLVWLLHWAIGREPWPLTPVNSALLLFALVIPVAVWASAMPELTLPKLTGLILGLAAFRVVTLMVHDRRTLVWGLTAFAVAGLGILVIGVLGLGWPGKVRMLQPIIARIPRLLVDLPGTPDQGINPNQLAGVLTLYLPIVMASVVGWWSERRHWPCLISLIGLGLVAGTLILTQSRGGWIGGATGLLAWVVLLGLTSRRSRTQWMAVVLLISVLVAVGITAFHLMPRQTGATFFGAEATSAVEEEVGQITLAGREEIWSRAIYAIQDFPFTGTGLGTFRQVVRLLYPLFLVGPDADVGHAHNIFLQTALDLGLLGLISYLAMLWAAGAVAWRTARSAAVPGSRGSPLIRSLATGMIAGLIGLHVYGLTDAIAPGSKPGIALWMLLGLMAALPRIVYETE